MGKKNGKNGVKGVPAAQDTNQCPICGESAVQNGMCQKCGHVATLIDTQNLPVDPALTAVLDARLQQEAKEKAAAEKQAATEKAIADAKAKVAAQAATADKAKAVADNAQGAARAAETGRQKYHISVP